MKKDEILIVLFAALSVLFMFLPSLIFNAVCMLGYCDYVSGDRVVLAQFVQVCWLTGCLCLELFTNHFSFIRARAR